MLEFDNFDAEDPFDRDALGRFNFDYETKKDLDKDNFNDNFNNL